MLIAILCVDYVDVDLLPYALPFVGLLEETP